MRIIILFVTIILSGQLIFAQEVNSDTIQVENTTPAIVLKTAPLRDSRLDKMVKWQIEKNKKSNGIDGFRVEIFFSAELDAKEQALNKKVEFLSQYPDYAVHIKYDAPNFRVRVGDFRTKNEALKLYKEIEKNYPVAFIVADKIEFPLLKK